MDRMTLERISFYGYHGVFPEETKLGQHFIVDAELGLNLRKAGETDDLVETVNYAEAYGLIKTIVEGKPYKLIEALAEAIASTVLDTYTMVQEVKIRVTKPNPPFPIHFQGVTIEISRKRA